MRCRWLGWAGIEVQDGAARIVIDPLRDAAALYAAVGDAARDVTLPALAGIGDDPPAIAGLVTHLHRDHADAGALDEALAPGAPVFVPPAEPSTTEAADAALLQAAEELGRIGHPLVETRPWQRLRIGPFTVTALPAADGTGDPQVSWAVEAGGRRILHAGDTLFHGWWWRAAMEAGPFDVAFLPVNGAVVRFPWRRPTSPLPAVMTPEDAAVAARALGAARAVPIHFGGYDLDPYYRPVPDALGRFRAAAEDRGVAVAALEPGETLDLAAA
jgi:L-ascorbate metabolism protein UlaG (beta-lactamase superfamily)